MAYLLNNHVGRYAVYLKFDTKGQLSTRLYEKGDDFSLVNFYFPIVSSGGLVDIDGIVDHHGLSPSLHNHISHRIVGCQKDY